ncbi:MAG: hypothetical protein WKF55_03080 [Gemmatimonadaceae bacterium]
MAMAVHHRFPDYRFNLAYGREYTADHPVLATLRQILDDEAERRSRET